MFDEDGEIEFELEDEADRRRERNRAAARINYHEDEHEAEAEQEEGEEEEEEQRLEDREQERRSRFVEGGDALKQELERFTPNAFSPDDLSFRRYRRSMLGMTVVAFIMTALRAGPQLVHAVLLLQGPQRYIYFNGWDTFATLLNCLLVVPYLISAFVVLLRYHFTPSFDLPLGLAKLKANPCLLFFWLGVLQLGLLLLSALGGDITHLLNYLREDDFLSFRVTFDLMQLLSLALLLFINGQLCFKVTLTTAIAPALQWSPHFFQKYGEPAAHHFGATDAAAVRKGVFVFNVVAASLALLPSLLMWLVGIIFEQDSDWSYMLMLCPVAVLMQLACAIFCLVTLRNKPAFSGAAFPWVQAVNYGFSLLLLLLGAVFQVVPIVGRADHQDMVLQRFIFGLFYYPFAFLGFGSLIQTLIVWAERRGYLLIFDLSPKREEDLMLQRHQAVDSQRLLRRLMVLFFVLYLVASIVLIILSRQARIQASLVTIDALVQLVYPLLALLALAVGQGFVNLYPFLSYSGALPVFISIIENLAVSGLAQSSFGFSWLPLFFWIFSLAHLLILLISMPIFFRLKEAAESYPDVLRMHIFSDFQPLTEQTVSEYDTL